MPEIISTSISDAWLQAITLAQSAKGHELQNLLVTISNLDEGLELEDQDFRKALDAALSLTRCQSVQTVANTIFPELLWDRSKPRELLYERYKRIWPKVLRHQPQHRGTYFQRLIAYPYMEEGAFNQLEHVIGAYLAGTRRRSTLQCSVIVPQTDLTRSRVQGFPCMQQISFMAEKGLLRVVALYPLHYLWERAYGNYLGLVNLSRFMADHMHLRLSSITCVSCAAVLENVSEIARFLNE